MTFNVNVLVTEFGTGNDCFMNKLGVHGDPLRKKTHTELETSCINY